jgi:hypothetical protein
VRTILDRFHTNADNRLSLEGFLQYQTDQAWHSPKNPWKDLHAFGYRNDLTRNPNYTPGQGHGQGQVGVGALPAPVPAAETRPTPLSLPLGSLLPRTCKLALCTFSLLEVGLDACQADASARAITTRVVAHDPQLCIWLARQALVRLYKMTTESAWGNHIAHIIEFLRLYAGAEGDDLVALRIRQVLLAPDVGMVVVAFNERLRPSVCRANEYERVAVFNRYVSYIQEICQTSPAFVDGINALCAEDERVRFVKRYLRLNPTISLIEHEAYVVKHATIEVSKSLRPEINGIYTFVSFKHNAGFYSRVGQHDGKEVCFTLYKCTVNNGGFQWFLSVTPEGCEPGTNKDIDFYFAHAKNDFFGLCLPPKQFGPLNPATDKLPGPTVMCTLPTDADMEASFMVLPEGATTRLEQLQQAQRRNSFGGVLARTGVTGTGGAVVGLSDSALVSGSASGTGSGSGSGSRLKLWICQGGGEQYGSIPDEYSQCDPTLFISSVVVEELTQAAHPLSPGASPRVVHRTGSGGQDGRMGFMGLDNVSMLDGYNLGVGGLEEDTEVENDDNPSNDLSGDNDLDSSSDEGSMVVGDGTGQFLPYGDSAPGSPARGEEGDLSLPPEYTAEAVAMYQEYYGGYDSSNPASPSRP